MTQVIKNPNGGLRARMRGINRFLGTRVTRVTREASAGADELRLTHEEWSLVAGVLWDYARTPRRSPERRARLLELRRRIVDACREEWAAARKPETP